MLLLEVAAVGPGGKVEPSATRPGPEFLVVAHYPDVPDPAACDVEREHGHGDAVLLSYQPGLAVDRAFQERHVAGRPVGDFGPGGTMITPIPASRFADPAPAQRLEQAAAALRSHGFTAEILGNAAAARIRVKDLIPEDAACSPAPARPSACPASRPISTPAGAFSAASLPRAAIDLLVGEAAPPTAARHV
jgi:hypothetical protein